MAFNPDEYLAQKTAGNAPVFNPDEYLAQKVGNHDGLSADNVQPTQKKLSLLERFKQGLEEKQRIDNQHLEMEHSTSSSQGGPTSELNNTLNNASWLDRNLAGVGSVAAKTYYGAKQLLTGGSSPDDKRAIADWNTIGDSAPVGALVGNIGVLGAFPTVSVPKIVAQGATMAALQPTENGTIAEHGIEGLKGGAAGLAGAALVKGLGTMATNVSNNGVLQTAGSPIKNAVSVATGKPIAPTASATYDELARINTLRNLPVPITDNDIIRSQITRSYPQQESERLIAGQPIIGSELAARLASGQDKMAKNLDYLASNTGAKAPTQEEAGNTVREWAQNIYGAAKTDTQNAYDYAKKVNAGLMVQTDQSIVDTLSENKAMPGYKDLLSQAINQGIVTVKKGKLLPGTTNVENLDKFKVIANQVANSSDGMTKYAGGDIVNKVYNQLDNVAPEFREAANLRKRQGQMLEDPTVTQKILGNKNGRFGAPEATVGGLTIPDYKVGSEKLIGSLINGNIEDVRYLKGLMDTGTDAQKSAGLQAGNELKGAVVQGMQDVWNKTQTPQSKANQLNKYLNSIGDDKIKLIFGDAGFDQIKQFRDAAEIMNKGVPSPEGGSQTAGRLMAMGNKIIGLLEKIPFAGSTVIKAGGVIKDINTASQAKKIPAITNNSGLLKALGASLSNNPKYGAVMANALFNMSNQND